MVSDCIKTMMERKKLSSSYVADQLDCTTQNVYQTLIRDSWNLNQLIKYANVLDCDVEIVLKDRKSNERIVCNSKRT